MSALAPNADSIRTRKPRPGPHSQPSLFEPRTVTAATSGITHRNPRSTELDAARKVVPTLGGKRLQILEAIVQAGDVGRTDWDIIAATDILRSTVCSARNQLLEGQWIEDSGKERVSNETGFKSTVWIATRRGRNALAREKAKASCTKEKAS